MAVKNPELLPLFAQAKRLLEPYAQTFAVRWDEPGRYELWSDKPVVIDGRTKKGGVFFAGLIVQKSYVGFYYMPTYADDQLREFFGPELLRLLKGKSCFYLKRLTPELEQQMADALRRGRDLYATRGWIE